MSAEPIMNRGWVPAATTFGARLAVLRHAMGWGNVKEASVAVGVPVASWRSWEKEGRQPRNIVEAARRIAAATGCDYYWLIDGRPSAEAVLAEGPPQDATKPRTADADGASGVATGRVELPTFRFSVERSTS